MNVDVRKLVFCDESGFKYSMRRLYGRSKVGLPATKTVPAIRTKNISFSACISLDGVFFFEVMDLPYNAEHFSQFADKLIDRFRRQ